MITLIIRRARCVRAPVCLSLRHCRFRLGLQEAKKQKKKEANKAKMATRPVHEQPHYVAGENPCQWPQVPHYPRQIAALCTNFVLTAQCAAQLIQVVLVR